MQPFGAFESIVLRHRVSNREKVLLWLGLLFLLGGCSPRKDALINFNSLYSPYPQQLEKFKIYLEEGRPDYVIFKSEGYPERWIYLCENKVYNFQPNSHGGGELEVASQPLGGSKLEKKLSRKDRQRLQDCNKAKEGTPSGAGPPSEKEN